MNIKIVLLPSALSQADFMKSILALAKANDLTLDLSESFDTALIRNLNGVCVGRICMNTRN